jgi:hypothetical protein
VFWPGEACPEERRGFRARFQASRRQRGAYGASSGVDSCNGKRFDGIVAQHGILAAQSLALGVAERGSSDAVGTIGAALFVHLTLFVLERIGGVAAGAQAHTGTRPAFQRRASSVESSPS